MGVDGDEAAVQAHRAVAQVKDGEVTVLGLGERCGERPDERLTELGLGENVNGIAISDVNVDGADVGGHWESFRTGQAGLPDGENDRAKLWEKQPH